MNDETHRKSQIINTESNQKNLYSNETAEAKTKTKKNFC